MAEKKRNPAKRRKKPKKPRRAKSQPKKAAPKAAKQSESQTESQSEKAARRATTGLDKSVEQFRESLEQSVTLSRDRLQEVVDDAVKRGRMTRGDAEKMLSDLVKKGRRQTDTPAEGAGTAGQTGAQRGRRPHRSRSANRRPRPRGARAKNSARWSAATGEKPAARPRRGEQLEVEIDSLAFGGRGVARAEGFVVFVSGALPGDRVRVEVTKAKKRFAEARTVELLRPAPDRIADRCVHDGEPCPGAPWQGLAYEQPAGPQVRSRSARRCAGSATSTASSWRRSSPRSSSGATATSSSTPSASARARPILGFHARGRWDLIVDVEDCLLASERGNAARNAVRDWARLEAVPAYDGRSREGVLRNLVVREGWRTGQIQTRLVTSAARFPKPPVDLHTAIEGDSGGTDGPTGVLGEERLREELCGLKLEMSHGAFFQTNTEMAERLYAVAAEFAGLTGSERVFDLYCGIGTIGLSMAARAGEVWGLEIVARGDRRRRAQRRAQQDRRTPASSPAAPAPGCGPLLEKAGKPDVVVIDPPRAGLSQKIVRRVIECEAKRIVYVSCNPTTLAPNAAQLAEAGYSLRPGEAGRHVPPDPAHRVRRAAGEGRDEPRASGSPPGSTPRSPASSPRAAPSSATTRSGRTTIPARRAWRRWPSSPPRRPGSTSASRVIALDRTPPEAIAADIERLGLDPARLWLGVGAGFSEKPLTRMRESLPELRERLPGVRLVLAAMGPKMCALAGAAYDGAFFNWMTPEFAAGARTKVEAGAARGRPRDPAGLRLRPHRRRRRRRRAPGQGGVLLPRPPRRLPQPLRPPRRARGHGRRRRRRRRRRPGASSPPTPPSTRSSSAASPAPRSSR